MKIAANRADAFSRDPDSAIRAVLVYGPDDGLTRERLDAMTKAVAEDLNNPFRVTEIAAAALRDDPALLADEAAAIALTGGRRVVRVRDATDTTVTPIEAFLEDSPGDALVVVQAGTLGARSKLRKLFEDTKNAAAIACYADDERMLDQVIRDTLGAENITVSTEAMDYLTANLGADRGLSRAELEKLALYVGPGGNVGFDDAVASIGNSSALSIDDVVFSAAAGNGLAADRALNRSYQEGVNPVTILRALSRHLMRLHLARVKIDGGAAVDAAMKALRPPVFFKLSASFRQQLRIWSGPKLTRALALVLEAEQQCKRTGAPAPALCGRTVLQIAQLGNARPN
ncbi:MAG: DNA polymerase III subunit delta [Alphaproteobacteria bacterium]|nr:DNA polymerase III subunit delta [Alphaproteobacteria bacterium]